MAQDLYAEGSQMAEAFAGRAASVLGSKLAGLYLVGSYVLRDLHPGSDIDFTAVLTENLGADDADELRAVHRWMSANYPDRVFEGFYVNADDLRRHPDPASRRGWQFLGGELTENDKVRLVEWEMLRRCGRRVAGLSIGDLGIFDASADLAKFSRRNLVEYWDPWVERTGPYLMAGGDGPGGGASERAAWAAAWCVLGISRLYVAIVDGDIVSKSEAGRRIRSFVDPAWHRVLDASLAYRCRAHPGADDELARLGPDALAFSRHMMDEIPKPEEDAWQA